MNSDGRDSLTSGDVSSTLGEPTRERRQGGGRERGSTERTSPFVSGSVCVVDPGSKRVPVWFGVSDRRDGS